MKWRGLVKRFGVRFVICLIILGGVYLAFFWQSQTSHNIPSTDSEKLSALRAALGQSYLVGNSIAVFDQNDSVSYSTIGELQTRSQNDITALETALKRAPTQVKPELRNQVQSVIDKQQAASKAMSARYGILSKVIAYDPTSDLGELDISKDREKLLQRTKAAQDGFQKAANNPATVTTSSSSGDPGGDSSDDLSVQKSNQSPQLISDDTRQALQAQANCFETLANQLTANQVDKVAATRRACIKTQTLTRQAAIAGVVQPYSDKLYQKSMKDLVTPLLQKLDKLIKTQTLK